MRLSSDDLGVFFTAEHHRLADRLREVMVELVARERAAGEAERAAGVAAAMGELGLYEWLLPRALPEAPDAAAAGRSGAVDSRALCLIREALGYASPLGDAIFAVQGLGSYPLFMTGSGDGDSAHAAIIDRCRRGAAIGGFALTEPEAGSDVASLSSTAAAAGGTRFRLHGTKIFISNVGIASHFVVFASADPAAGRKGISAFLLAADAPGLTLRPIAMGIEHPIGELHMDGCEAELVGEPGSGFTLAMQTLDTFRVTVGAAAVGMARRALDEALAHVRARKQFGRPLAEQQVVQSYLADMATELDAARLLVLRAAYERDRGRPRVTTEAAMAKLYATEAAQRIIDTAVQLFGGRGVVSGAVVESLYRAIRPLRIYEGTSEIQRLIIGRAFTYEDGQS